MLVTVPQIGARFPYDALTGLNGLGQTDTDTYSFDETPTYSDTTVIGSAGNVSASSLNISNPYAPVTSTDLLTTDADTLLGTDGASTPAVAPPVNLSSATGPVSQSGSAVTPATGPIMTGPLPTPAQLAQVVQSGTSGTGLTAAQIAQIFTSASSAGLAIFKATSSPSLIPGTNLVYNPATGQVTNSLTGLTGSQLASTLGVGSLSIGTLLLLGGAAFLLIMLSNKK